MEKGRIYLINPFWYYGGVETLSLRLLDILSGKYSKSFLYVLVNKKDGKFLRPESDFVRFITFDNFNEWFSKKVFNEDDVVIFMRPKFNDKNLENVNGYMKTIKKVKKRNSFKMGLFIFGNYDLGGYDNFYYDRIEDFLKSFDFVLTDHNYRDKKSFVLKDKLYDKKPNFHLYPFISTEQYQKVCGYLSGENVIKERNTIVYAGRFSFDRDIKTMLNIFKEFEKHKYRYEVYGCAKDYRAVNYALSLDNKFKDHWHKDYNNTKFLGKFRFGVYLRKKMSQDKYFDGEIYRTLLENSVLEYMVNGVIPIVSDILVNDNNARNFYFFTDRTYDSIFQYNNDDYTRMMFENFRYLRDYYNPQDFANRLKRFIKRI